MVTYWILAANVNGEFRISKNLISFPFCGFFCTGRPNGPFFLIRDVYGHDDNTQNIRLVCVSDALHTVRLYDQGTLFLYFG